MRYPKTYVVYDLETTGIDTSIAEPIEIGAILVVDGKEKERRSWLVKPSKPVTDTITQITGITNELLDREGRPAEECLREFLAFVSNFPLVGHNISRYDNLVINSAVARVLFGHFPREVLMNDWVDTAALVKAKQLGEEQLWRESHMDFATRVLNIKAFGVRYKLADTFLEMGGSMEGIEAHRALSDCLMTDFIYRKLTQI